MTSDTYLAIIANLDHYSARQRVEAFAKKAHTLHLRLRFFEQSVSVSRIIDDPRCAAVLLCNVDPERGFHSGLRSLKKPVLEASRKIDTPWPQVFLDEQEIARMSYRHFQLLQRNHFAYVGRQQSLSSSEREEAFRKLIQHPRQSYTSIDVNLRSDLRCRQSLHHLLNRLPKPVNILGFEDRISEKILEECEFLQFKVPADVAVLSFGDDPLLTSFGSHNMSSIVFPSEEIGYRSAEILYNLINGHPHKQEIIRVKPLELRIRNSTDPAASSDPTLAKAISYIRREIRNAPRVGDVAKAAGISRRGLEMRFREKLDKSVGEQIQEFRMEMALNLIRSTSRSMEEISESCGFSSAAVFSRAFRAWTGDTPSSHRARIIH